MKKGLILILMVLVMVYGLVDHFYISNYPLHYKSQISSVLGTEDWEVSDKEVKSTPLLTRTVTHPNEINTYNENGEYTKWYINYTRNGDKYTLELNNLTSKYNKDISNNENFAIDIYDEMIYLSRLEIANSISKYFNKESFQYINPKNATNTDFGVQINIRNIDNYYKDYYSDLYEYIHNINLQTFKYNDLINLLDVEHYIEIEICTSNEDVKYLTELAKSLSNILIGEYVDKANFLIDIRDTEEKHILSLFGYHGKTELIKDLDESYDGSLYKRENLYKEYTRGYK